jgi:dimethylargininase
VTGLVAVTRGVSPSIQQSELTHLERVPIDLPRAVQQHEHYVQLLRSLGLEVIELPADAAYPDCVFVEDTAVVLDEIAVITRPGAESRRGETAAMADVLRKYRPLVHLAVPATLDGGDVLQLDDQLFVGASERTNDEGRRQLQTLTGREVVAVPLHGALHLKTAVTRIGPQTLLVNREWVDLTPFSGWELVDADPREPFAANALWIGDTVVFPTEFPHTRERLERAGIRVRTVDAGELAKAEGGVTCSSVIFRKNDPAAAR